MGLLRVTLVRVPSAPIRVVVGALPAAIEKVPPLITPLPGRCQAPRVSVGVGPPVRVPSRLTVLAASRLKLPRPAWGKAPLRVAVEPVTLMVPVFDHESLLVAPIWKVELVTVMVPEFFQGA